MIARKAIVIATLVTTACAARSEPARSPTASGDGELAKIEAKRANAGNTDAIIGGVLFVLGGMVGVVTTVGVAIAGHR